MCIRDSPKTPHNQHIINQNKMEFSIDEHS
jgi:hypothetical protein